ncbi:hypothetical protein DRQ53_14110 [bacterium]|nr:MAG: hypothetical protein DRQ53_14110 [bacterium]
MDWLYFRFARTNQRVAVYVADHGMADIYRRHGWEQYTPLVESVESMTRTMKAASQTFDELASSIRRFTDHVIGDEGRNLANH